MAALTPSTIPVIPDDQLFKLKERTILLTGGCGGVGRTVTETLLEAGADVVITDLPDTPPEDVWAPLKEKAEQTGQALKYYQMNTADEKSVQAVFGELERDTRHPLKGLVTCAAIFENIDAIDYPIENFRKIYSVNVMGSFMCAQATARIMRKQNVQGSIVLMASMSGSIVNQGVNTCAYNSSKSAVLQLARSLAHEWSNHPDHPPIRVNTLSPGYIRTEATRPTLENNPDMDALWTSKSMLGRLSFAHEFRAPIMFLLSDGNSYMTGSELRVDAGCTSW